MKVNEAWQTFNRWHWLATEPVSLMSHPLVRANRCQMMSIVMEERWWHCIVFVQDIIPNALIENVDASVIASIS